MLSQLVLITLLQAQSGLPEPSWDIPGVEIDDNIPEVFLVSGKQRRQCSSPGLVCLSPGGSATSEGIELREAAAPITVLARGSQLAAVGAVHKPDPNQPWQVEMVANFKGRSASGPMIVAILDGENPQALEDHQALVVWDVNMKPGSSLGMRFLLTPEQGFRPSHSYVLRVVQGRDKAEKILAEGEFHLE
jgi:hypothetical protein